MNLILQAIKSLLKKIENHLSELHGQMDRRIKSVKIIADNAQVAADNAQVAADNAQVAADNAQVAADNAQLAADTARVTASNSFQILKVTSLASNVGIVSSSAVLLDGRLYGIVSSVDYSNAGYAELQIKNKNYSIYVRNPDYGSYQSLSDIGTRDTAARVFRAHMVYVVQYSATKNAFISVSGYNLNGFYKQTNFTECSSYEGFLVARTIQNSTGYPETVGVSRHLCLGSSVENSTKRFEVTADDNGTVTLRNEEDGQEIVLAKTTDIPDSAIAPDTAAVGQVISVSAIDENGKPTEFEAVDRPKNIVIIDNGQLNDSGSYIICTCDSVSTVAGFEAAILAGASVTLIGNYEDGFTPDSGIYQARGAVPAERDDDGNVTGWKIVFEDYNVYLNDERGFYIMLV